MFTRFLLSGGIAALVNIISRIFFSLFFYYSLSIILAYSLGVLTAYFLNKKYVFIESGKRNATEFGRFILVNIFSVILILLISNGLSNYIFPLLEFNFFPNDIAHIIGVLSTAISSYFLHKFFTFRVHNE